MEEIIAEKTEKSVPGWVKTISILYYIGSALGIIGGLLFLLGAGLFDSIAEQIPLIGVLGSIIFIIAGIVMLVFGILWFFIGRGLWKGKKWARIFAIILSILGILIGVYSMVQGSIISNLFGVVLNFIISLYLLFSNKVKEAFG